jgi:hypothetical protein
MPRAKVALFRRRGAAKREEIDIESLHAALIPTAKSFWESLGEKSCGELRELLSQKWIPAHREAIEKAYKEKGC